MPRHPQPRSPRTRLPRRLGRPPSRPRPQTPLHRLQTARAREESARRCACFRWDARTWARSRKACWCACLDRPCTSARGGQRTQPRQWPAFRAWTCLATRRFRPSWTAPSTWVSCRCTLTFRAAGSNGGPATSSPGSWSTASPSRRFSRRFRSRVCGSPPGSRARTRATMRPRSCSSFERHPRSSPPRRRCVHQAGPANRPPPPPQSGCSPR